jgi:hypothetical protein
MSVIKLVIYGAVGYLVYQTFFAEMPASRSSGGQGGGGRGSRGGQDPGQNETQGIENQASSGPVFTGGGHGRTETATGNDGGTVRHNVGRGVVR